jgi:hypothetical protein
MRNRLALLLGPLVLAGCAATAPTRPDAATAVSDCNLLFAEIGEAEQAQRAAREKQETAWKAVVPFAIAGRYASGKSEASDAEERLAELRAAWSRQGCPAAAAPGPVLALAAHGEV